MKKSIRVPRVEGFEKLEQFATDTIECINWAEYPYKPSVRFYIGYTEEALLVRYEVEEAHTKAICTTANGPVWEDSCVELFIKEPDSPFYFNFETNCIGVGLSAKRRSRSDCAHFTPEQAAPIVRHSSLPATPIDIKDGRWSLELTLPFSVLELNGTPERLLANLYKCGDGTTPIHFVSWSPIGVEQPDFHRPEWFGELIFDK